MRRQKSIKPTRRPRIAKRGVSAGATAKAKLARKRAIVEKLTPMLGEKVRNTEMKKNIYITPKGLSETAHHAAKSELSTIAAMDAKRQLRDAKLVTTVKPKTNRRQRDMRLVKMKKMRGSIAGCTTNVYVGVSDTRQHLMYSITAKRKRKK